jgi:hypothetical protein
MASFLDSVHIWYVMFSSCACVHSTWRAISPILARMTGCSIRILPNVLRFSAYLNDSSRHTRAKRLAWMVSAQRSWLKLYLRKGARQARPARYIG